MNKYIKLKKKKQLYSENFILKTFISSGHDASTCKCVKLSEKLRTQSTGNSIEVRKSL